MTVTIDQNNIKVIDPYTWELTWSSDLGGSPTFYVYVDGTLSFPTQETTGRFTADYGVYPVVEVLDDSTAAPSTAFPARVFLSWNTVAGTDYYLIEEDIATVWTERARIRDEGQSFFKWLTRALEDVTSHDFRVTSK